METRFANLLRAPKCGEQISCADPVWERTRKRKRKRRDRHNAPNLDSHDPFVISNHAKSPKL